MKQIFALIKNGERVTELEGINILVIPSVLFFRENNEPIDPYYKLLQDAEDKYHLTVYPYISTEKKMENKDQYMNYLNGKFRTKSGQPTLFAPTLIFKDLSKFNDKSDDQVKESIQQEIQGMLDKVSITRDGMDSVVYIKLSLPIAIPVLCY